MRCIVVFILLILILSSCKREFLNPYDSQTPPDAWMPADFIHTVTGNNSLSLSWTQANTLIDGFVLAKRKNGIEEFIDLDKNSLNYVDPSVLNSEELSGCAEVNYSIYAKARNYRSTTASLSSALVFPQPSPANAGSDQSPTGLSVTLNANAAGANESGSWTIVSGSGGMLQNPAQANTPFYGTAGISYGLRWTLEGACAASFDDVTIAMPVNPVGTLVSSNDCSNLTGFNTQYQALSGNTADWTLSSTGYSGNSLVAPDNSLGGLYGSAIGTHYVEFPIDLPGLGYLEFWKYTYYSGSQNIQPVIFVDGVQQTSPTVLETQNTYWQRVRTANIASGAHTVRIQFSCDYYQLKVDEIKAYQW
jgi:hypothetical protein